MARQLVENSSTIRSIEHFPETNKLRVEFHSGGTYEYPDINYEQYAAFCESESKGQHFHRFIRNRTDAKGNALKGTKV